MTASTPTTVSPSRVRIIRKTPWDEGCCGPMFIMRRSLPPYPTSTTCLVCVTDTIDVLRLANLFHRRRRRRDQGHRAHLDEQRCRLAQERLPLWILEGLAAHGGPIVQIAVHPEVHDLVELGDL